MMKSSSAFDDQLANSYKEVFAKAISLGELSDSGVARSREFFDFDDSSTPFPKKLEVVALLGGLPFSYELRTVISAYQKAIQGCIPEKMAYWVKEENLGVEVIVLKWPDQESPSHSQIKELCSLLDRGKYSVASLVLGGVQVHDDGCVIMRGFDSGRLRNIRSSIVNELSFIPKRQSNWVHIPLGRILEPVARVEFRKILATIEELNEQLIFSEPILNLKLVHERNWYMTNRETLAEFQLENDE